MVPNSKGWVLYILLFFVGEGAMEGNIVFGLIKEVCYEYYFYDKYLC